MSAMQTLNPRDAAIVLAPAPERISVNNLNFYYGESRALKEITLPLQHSYLFDCDQPYGHYD